MDAIRARAPKGVRVEFVDQHQGEPYDVVPPGRPNTPADQSPVLARAFRAADAAVTEIWGRPPLYLREGGSVPIIAEIKRVTGLDSVMLGLFPAGGQPARAQRGLQPRGDAEGDRDDRGGSWRRSRRAKTRRPGPSPGPLRSVLSGTGDGCFTQHQVDAAGPSPSWHRPASLLRLLAALGEVSNLSALTPRRDQVLLRSTRAAVAEGEVVLGGPAPVAMALEKHAVLRILVQIVLGRLELRALGRP